MLLAFGVIAIAICLVVFVFICCDLQDLIKKKIEFEQSCKVDSFVDSVVNKAVIISEYIVDRKDMSIIDFETKKLEQACSITADVLLQHGIRPKNYNLPALVVVAKHKNHFISIEPYKLGEN